MHRLDHPDDFAFVSCNRMFTASKYTKNAYLLLTRFFLVSYSTCRELERLKVEMAQQADKNSIEIDEISSSHSQMMVLLKTEHTDAEAALNVEHTSAIESLQTTINGLKVRSQR